MTDAEQELMINSLVKIGNHKRVIQECEPNIAFPGTLSNWMVKRTLVALNLYREALSKYGDTKTRKARKT